jgi:hypothetical protein
MTTGGIMTTGTTGAGGRTAGSPRRCLRFGDAGHEADPKRHHHPSGQVGLDGCPAADDNCTNSGAASRWDAMGQALNGFVSSPQANGIGIGLTFFGLQTTACLVRKRLSDAGRPHRAAAG